MQLFDRVKETTTTTGTGTITLAGAASGFRSFSVVGDGNLVYYAIVGTTEWEVGIGTYTSSGTTLARTTVLASSNSGSAVNFSAGTKDVFCTIPGRIGGTTPLLAAPVDGDFSWVNQGTASVATTSGGIYLLGPAASSDNLRIRKKTSPATPYTITGKFVPVTYPGNYNACGLLFRQSSDGKCSCIQMYWQSGWQFAVNKYNSSTSWSANYIGMGAGLVGDVICFRIADDGSSRKCSVSSDGYNWIEVHSVGRTDFLTADEVGFFVNPSNASGGIGMKLLSWEQA